MRSLRSLHWICLTLFVLGLALIGWQPVSAQSDLTFEPYSVFVAQQDVFARCGPSDEYYRTDPLRHGQSLEVYAETEDGWLGIRPPDDSFCWIPAETVEMESDETGSVIEDRTVAWIGTHLGRARTYRWQVQLAKGEPVTVVGRSEREGPDGPQLWYRIVPPSGEYRWVHRDQVVTSSEELVASRPQENTEIAGSNLGASADKEPSKVGARRDADRADAGKNQFAAGPSGSARNNEKTAPSDSSAGRASNSQFVDSSGRSVLESPRAVGSGLNENWQSNEARAPREAVREAATVTEAMQRGGLLASVEFLSRPRLLDIGSGPAAPDGNASASDANWVSGSGRVALAPQNRQGSQTVTPQTVAPQISVGGTNVASPGAILQASGTEVTGSPMVTRALNTRTIVSAERIAQIESEVRGADFERLSLIFSRLMAAQATAVETEPIERAARSLASSSTDAVVAGRARELAQRVERYRRVAQHRDGVAVIRNTGQSSAAVRNQGSVAATVVPLSTAGGSAVNSSVYAEPGTQTATETGYLVQVYSARTSSPPFALTDNAGRTLAYVTPLPGVNLRIHLNSKVQVVGNSGFVTGLNTPHILATQAVRTPE